MQRKPTLGVCKYYLHRATWMPNHIPLFPNPPTLLPTLDYLDSGGFQYRRNSRPVSHNLTFRVYGLGLDRDPSKLDTHFMAFPGSISPHPAMGTTRDNCRYIKARLTPYFRGNTVKGIGLMYSKCRE